MLRLPVLVLTSSLLLSCSSPNHSPDQTAVGAVVGAGWGAGAGAVIGNQVANAGKGAGVGAGFGLVGGMLIGSSLDNLEGEIADNRDMLASLKVQNLENTARLQAVQYSLDNAPSKVANVGPFRVYFDIDATSLRAGSSKNLEVLAEAIKKDLGSRKITVVGHADDSGNPDHNKKLSKARAAEIKGYLMRRGISGDQIITKSEGSTEPLVSNTNEAGRQLNRRAEVYVTY